MRILSVADPVSTLGSLVVALLTLVSTQANGQALTQGALFTGTVGGADVQLIIVERGDEVFAASYRPAADRDALWDLPLTSPRLLTGTRIGGRLQLREWRQRNDESATVAADMVGQVLRGTWHPRGSAQPFRFSLHRVPLFPAGWGQWNLGKVQRITPPVIDRLHSAVRTGRWDDAAFETKLLCVLTVGSPIADGCGWIDAVAAFASGREPPVTPGAPWAGLVLERDGKYVEAFDTYRELCSFARSACAFMLDVRHRVDSAQRREALALACGRQEIGCEAYWGINEVALIRAARHGQLAEVERILKGRVNPNAGEGKLITPLLAAVLAKSFQVVRALVRAGADPNRESYGQALDYAISQGSDDIALFLLDNGAKANNGFALMNAVEGRKRAIAKKILANGEHPDEKYQPIGSPLTMAVINRDLELIEALVRHGADPDFSTNFSDGSPIDHARRTRQAAALKILVAARKPR